MAQVNFTIEKLNEITQKSGFTKGCKAYVLIKSSIITGNKKICPVLRSGRGRFTKNLDYSYDVKNALNKMGVTYVTGNDGLRGGKVHDYIIIN